MLLIMCSQVTIIMAISVAPSAESSFYEALEKFTLTIGCVIGKNYLASIFSFFKHEGLCPPEWMRVHVDC